MNKLINKPEICITGLGMVTPVGHDVKTACASIRAGIKRPTKLDNFYVESKAGYDEWEDGLVTGHPVFEYNYDDTETRLFSLFSMVLEDLYKFFGEDSPLMDNTPVFLALPEKYREKTDKEKLTEFIDTESNDPDKFKFKTGNITTFNEGHAGMITALTQAVESINNGLSERAIIVGIDSLIGFDDLSLFNKEKRLKTQLNSDGFIPGEAASAILIEKITTAEKRKAEICAVIEIISTGHEDDHVISENNATGNALSKVISAMLPEKEEYEFNPSNIISDLNGEIYRFEEWSMVLPKVMNKISGKKEMIYPARYTGDTGAASAGVSICFAVRTMEKKEGDIMVLASSDSGARGAVYLKGFVESEKG